MPESSRYAITVSFRGAPDSGFKRLANALVEDATDLGFAVDRTQDGHFIASTYAAVKDAPRVLIEEMTAERNAP